jgi:hypothetical protein
MEPAKRQGDKQEGRLGEIGMPMGKPSAVKHNKLAGESACPTYIAGKCRTPEGGSKPALYILVTPQPTKSQRPDVTI